MFSVLETNFEKQLFQELVKRKSPSSSSLIINIALCSFKMSETIHFYLMHFFLAKESKNAWRKLKSSKSLTWKRVVYVAKQYQSNRLIASFELT